MQVLCERSNTASDVRCAVCGQSFLVWWERSSGPERLEARARVLQALRDHHLVETSCQQAHPLGRFTISGWGGDARLAVAALPGGAADLVV